MRTILRILLVPMLISTGSASAQLALDCATDRHIYRPGQSVEIECTNHTDQFVVTGITFLVTRPDGVPVYNPAVPAIAVAVPPAESVEHSWDQTLLNSPLGGDGDQARRGRYVVSVQNGAPARLVIGV